jgi:hypothetical protein
MSSQVGKVLSSTVPSDGKDSETQQQNFQALFRAVWSVTGAICSKQDFHSSGTDMRRACRYLMRSVEFRDKLTQGILLATLQDEDHINIISTEQTKMTSKGGEVSKQHHLQSFADVKRHDPKLAEMLRDPLAHLRNMTEEVCVRTAGVCPTTVIRTMNTCDACLLVLNDFNERMAR